MARKTAVSRSKPEPPLRERGPYRPRKDACSFCADLTTNGVRHDLCPGTIGKWTCPCWKGNHEHTS